MHETTWFRSASLTSVRPNLVWRFVIPASLSLQLWPQNENLVFGNDFNARASRWDSDPAKPPLGSERARRVTFITSEMGTLTEEAR